MFKINSFIVYPGQGVGQISSIETKEILGFSRRFYVVSIMPSGMRIIVPVDSSEKVGLRNVVDVKTARKALAIINGPTKVDKINWNRLYRKYMEVIKIGDILQTAKILADLKTLNVERDLSFGERKMIDHAKTMIFYEISIVLKLSA